MKEKNTVVKKLEEAFSFLKDKLLFQYILGLFTDINKENAGEKIWLRVERQTFRRLERTGLVVFGIRTHMNRLDSAITNSGDAKRLISAIEQLPESVVRYKSMGVFREPCLDWLAGV